MMGMVRAACPELEVTIRLKQLWNRYINSAPINEGTPASAFPMVYKIVFSVDATFASEPPSTRRIPLAIPTTTAVPARSATPLWKADAIPLTVISLSLKMTAVTPAANPITKNWEAISGI